MSGDWLSLPGTMCLATLHAFPGLDLIAVSRLPGPVPRGLIPELHNLLDCAS